MTTQNGGCYFFGGLAADSYIVHIPGSEFGSGRPLENRFSSAGADVDSGIDDDVNENGIDNADPANGGISSFPISLTAGGEVAAAETGKDSDSDDASGELDNDLTVDFGFVGPGVGIGNLVFGDTDGDGVFESGAGETGIDDVIVQLFSAGSDPAVDTPVAVTTTSGGGCYLFTGLVAGDYFIHIPASEFGGGEPLVNLVSSPGDGGDTAVDDDGDENGIDSAGPGLAGVSTGTISLAVGDETTPETGKDGTVDNVNEDDHDLSVDLGFTPRTGVGIGNLVFCDEDGDGVFETGDGDAGVPGVTVELYNAGDTPGVDSPVRTTVTGPDGTYYFGDLTGGDYVVHIPASEFGASAPLDGKTSSSGNGGDDGQDDNLGENGIDAPDPATTGVSSGTVVLASGSEPTEGGEGGGGDNSAESDNDLTVDLAFTDSAGTVGIGNLVFFDANKDGGFNVVDDSGVDGVTVELYLSSAGPGVGSPVATTETHSGGCYLFTGLAPESYVVHIPASEFGVGGDLENLVSMGGAGSDQTTDDDGDENGDDDLSDGVSSNAFALAVTGMPTDAGSETGKDSASDNTVDAAFNLTADFGFEYAKANGFAEFVGDFGLTGDDALPVPTGGGGAGSGTGGNPDNDRSVNLTEYALCLHPETGLEPKEGFCAYFDVSTDNIDARFSRPAGITDVTYTLEAIDDLLTSPAGWFDVTTITPVVVDNGDGSETVTLPDLESIAGLAVSGNVRLRMDLDTDGNAATVEATSYSEVFGWSCETAADEQCRSVSDPYLSKPTFIGWATTVTGQLIDVSGSLTTGDDLGAVLQASGEQYILEVTTGICDGHRFDVDETNSTPTEIAITSSSVFNTKALGTDLANATLVLRPHRTISDLNPPSVFNLPGGGGDPILDADRLLFYDASTTMWVNYALVPGPVSGNVWTDESIPNFDDDGDRLVDPCSAWFFHPKNGAVTIKQVGMVRDWSFACPLAVDFNLVGGGYPVDQSFDARGMDVANGFVGSNSQSQADRVHFWFGDDVVGAKGYDGHFLVDVNVGGTDYEFWTSVANSNFDNENALLLFEASEGAYLQMQSAHPLWVMPPGWSD
ncbi:MAG: SdrD B-like domain-containing protein [Verrucomicrobiota bacterium]